MSTAERAVSGRVPTMMPDAEPHAARRFRPLPGSDLIVRVGFVAFGAAALLAAAAFVAWLVYGGEGELAEARFWGPFGALFFGGLALWCRRQCRLARAGYVCDDTGIRRVLGDRETFLHWSEIEDVAFTFPGGMGELVITLRTRQGPELRIPTEYLESCGRSLVETLFERLPGILEARTRRFLDGAETWSTRLLGAKIVLRLKGGLLVIEFPGRRRKAISVSDLERVEWLPGAVSGSRAAQLIIEHRRGRIDLPQTFNGLPHFLHALTHHYGLGAIVNPELPEPAELERLRVSIGNRFALLVGSAVLCVFGIVGGCFSAWVAAREAATRTSEMEAEATVAAKHAGYEIDVGYVDIADRRREQRERVTSEFYASIEVGDPVAILMHPRDPGRIHFEGRDPKGHPRSALVIAALLVLSTSLTLWLQGRSFWRACRRAGELGRGAPDHDARTPGTA